MIIQFERGDIGDLLKINIALPDNFVYSGCNQNKNHKKNDERKLKNVRTSCRH